MMILSSNQCINSPEMFSEHFVNLFKKKKRIFRTERKKGKKSSMRWTTNCVGGFFLFLKDSQQSYRERKKKQKRFEKKVIKQQIRQTKFKKMEKTKFSKLISKSNTFNRANLVPAFFFVFDSFEKNSDRIRTRLPKIKMRFGKNS